MDICPCWVFQEMYLLYLLLGTSIGGYSLYYISFRVCPTTILFSSFILLIFFNLIGSNLNLRTIPLNVSPFLTMSCDVYLDLGDLGQSVCWDDLGGMLGGGTGVGEGTGVGPSIGYALASIGGSTGSCLAIAVFFVEK